MERNKLSILNLSIFEYMAVSECFVNTQEVSFFSKFSRGDITRRT